MIEDLEHNFSKSVKRLKNLFIKSKFYKNLDEQKDLYKISLILYFPVFCLASTSHQSFEENKDKEGGFPPYFLPCGGL